VSGGCAWVWRVTACLGLERLTRYFSRLTVLISMLNPPPIQQPIANEKFIVNQIWQRWFRDLLFPYGYFVTLTASGILSDRYDHVLADTTSGNVTLTLPQQKQGAVYWVKKKTAANTLTVSGGGVNIDGAATKAWTTQYEAYCFWSDGSQWWVF